MKAVSCQNGGRGLPSCSRDWALRFTLRSLNCADMLRASRENLMSWPMLGGSSSWNFRETWTTSLGRREGAPRLQGSLLPTGIDPGGCETAWPGPWDLPNFSLCRAFRNTCLSWGEPRRAETTPSVGQADPATLPNHKHSLSVNRFYISDSADIVTLTMREMDRHY